MFKKRKESGSEGEKRRKRLKKEDAAAANRLRSFIVVQPQQASSSSETENSEPFSPNVASNSPDVQNVVSESAEATNVHLQSSNTETESQRIEQESQSKSPDLQNVASESAEATNIHLQSSTTGTESQSIEQESSNVGEESFDCEIENVESPLLSNPLDAGDDDDICDALDDLLNRIDAREESLLQNSNPVAEDDEMEGLVGTDSVGRANEQTSADDLEVVIDQFLSDAIKFKDISYLQQDRTTNTFVISHETKVEIVKRGMPFFQNKSGPFAQNNGRAINSSWFARKIGGENGTFVPRSWLSYSPRNVTCYCLPCIVFGSGTSSSLAGIHGFNNFKDRKRMESHEKSTHHQKCVNEWITMAINIKSQKGYIDQHLKRQIEKEKEKWRKILTRIIAVIKTMATQNMAFRGHRENLRDSNDENVGNFLALMELIGQFDDVTKEHIEYVKKNAHAVSYFSPEIQNEIIGLLANATRQKILARIKIAKFFGILFDSTPDNAHREQLAYVLRYVYCDFNEKTVKIYESFLGLRELLKKDAASTKNVITNSLKEDGLDLANARSQCYDNARVMSGEKNGVSALILRENQLALYMNCNNHSLNLVGVHTASEETALAAFFVSIDAVYNFFARSTIRWDRLIEALGISLHSQSETRWSSRHDAVEPIFSRFQELTSLLEEMSSDDELNSETRADSYLNFKRLMSYDFIFLMKFWHLILKKIDAVQIRLQKPDIDFGEAFKDIKGLYTTIKNERDAIVEDCLEFGSEMCQELGIETTRRIKKDTLTAFDEMNRVMRAGLDRLLSELESRFKRLENLFKKFGFLMDMTNLIYANNDLEILEENCINFANFYKDDVCGKELLDEIIIIRMLLKEREPISKPIELLEFIVKFGEEDYCPNLRIALQILLTIAVSIATCERSFSQLALICTPGRATMSHERANNLTQLSIEKRVLNSLLLEELVDAFALAKARKAPL